MKLTIDSTNNKRLILTLDQEKKVVEYSTPRDQDILSEIEKMLAQKNLQIQDLTQIEVNPGPGHFTSLRVGIAIANALSFSLNIPINGRKPGTTIEPKYGSPPSITAPKKYMGKSI